MPGANVRLISNRCARGSVYKNRYFWGYHRASEHPHNPSKLRCAHRFVMRDRVWDYKNRDFLLVLFSGKGHIASTSETPLSIQADFATNAARKRTTRVTDKTAVALALATGSADSAWFEHMWSNRCGVGRRGNGPSGVSRALRKS